MYSKISDAARSKQRRLEREVGRALGFVGEALRELAPALLGLLEALERFLHFGIVGRELLRALVRAARAVRVEQLFRAQATELLPKTGRERGVVVDQLRLELDQRRDRGQLAFGFVFLTRSLEQADGFVAEPQRVALRDERLDALERSFVLGIVTQDAEVVGELRLRFRGPAPFAARGTRVDCTHVCR